MHKIEDMATEILNYRSLKAELAEHIDSMRDTTMNAEQAGNLHLLDWKYRMVCKYAEELLEVMLEKTYKSDLAIIEIEWILNGLEE